MANKFHFDRVIRNVEQLKRQLPIVLENQARNYFLDSFKNQGYDGKKWPEVQRRIPGTRAYKYPKNKDKSRRTRPILKGRTGALRRTVAAPARIRTFNRIRFVYDPPTQRNSSQSYAEFIQNGTPKMPARPFSGQTKQLTRMQKRTINTYIDRIWR
jgi:hypothetical protein